MHLVRDKKGLHKFIIGVIIGILCLIPLLYLGSTLMDIVFSNPRDMSQAEGTLDGLQNVMSSLLIDESAEQLIYSPAGWWLLGFDNESKTYVGMFDKEVKLSKECESKICVCICKDAADCTKNSVCKELEKPMLTSSGNIAVQIKIIRLKITNKEKSYEVEIIE